MKSLTLAHTHTQTKSVEVHLHAVSACLHHSQEKEKRSIINTGAKIMPYQATATIRELLQKSFEMLSHSDKIKPLCFS